MQRPWDEELPDCWYEQKQPSLIKPSNPTPKHILHLSNLDDQKFLRFSIKYLYLFQKSPPTNLLKHSLSRVLVDYYPLAGRLKTLESPHKHDDDDDNDMDDQKLQLDCNGEGAVFAEAVMDMSAQQFLQVSSKPNKSWRKLLFRVTKLCCGGMILCTAINHCLCDGIGTSQFLHAWAELATNPMGSVPVTPFHSRHVFKPSSPSSHIPSLDQYPAFTKHLNRNHSIKLHMSESESDPLVPASLTYTSSNLLSLKTQCAPITCTTFEVLASHTWRSWAKSLDLEPSLEVKLLFSVNIRDRIIPQIPKGYYANGFVLACAKMKVHELVDTGSLQRVVKLVQEAKSFLTDDCVSGILELLEDKNVETDLATTNLVISQWCKLGLEDLDFGQGRPLHMGPLTSHIYCLFLPVLGDSRAVRVLVSLPNNVLPKFEYYMNSFLES